MTYTIHHGNNLEILRTFADNSIDAIVTDPPYGLGKEPDALAMLRDWMTGDHHEVQGKGFMGKEWDAFVPQPALWKECLRVLKPGGHLLAFAGTRTQDLMALGLRIAGFEIRDLSAWLYSSGFPKSHNFGCRCSVGTLPNTHEEKVSRKQETKRDVRSLRNSNVSPPLESSEGRREVLQPSLPKQSTSIEGWKQFPTTEVWRGKSGLEGRSDVLEETRQLQADQIRTVSEGVFADGPQGRIRDGASFDNGANGRQMLNQNGSGASCESQPARQPTGEPGAFPEQHSTQERGMETDKTCPQCGKLRAWQGWGTALKPALEPITVARKPLVGTVAENVLEHGTGAINVDGCRVGTEGGTAKGSKPEGAGNGIYGAGLHGACEIRQLDAGRWPANVLHDGSEEVVRLFPGEGDTSAARFFKCCPPDETCSLCCLPYAEACDTMQTWKNTLVSIAEKRGWTSQATSGFIARVSAIGPASEKIAPLVKSAGNLCDSCAISIAVALVAIKTSAFSSEELQATLASTGSCNASILIPSLASFAELWASIDTIPTTSSLSLLFGSVRDAIANSTRQDTRAKAEPRCEPSRFAYVPKASKADRDKDNIHPTVKPTELMRYLCRLVTPPGGIVLDPFMGSGSTGKAAMLEGFRFIGIEREAEYVEIAKARIKAAYDAAVDSIL